MRPYIHFVIYISISTYLLSPQPLQAQEMPDIRPIVDQYIAVKEKISKNQLFSNIFNLNARNLSWHSTIDYKKTETYYYQFTNQNKIQLNFLKVVTDSVGSRYEIEYLYDIEGKIIYTYEKQNDPRYAYRELKVYFKDEKIIQILEDNALINSSAIFHSSKFKYIRETAEFYRQKFVEYMRLLPQY